SFYGVPHRLTSLSFPTRRSSDLNDLNVFVKANFQLDSHWSVYGDLQYRAVGYTANGEETGIVDDSFKFFNPKGGVTYDLNAHNRDRKSTRLNSSHVKSTYAVFSL